MRTIPCPGLDVLEFIHTSIIITCLHLKSVPPSTGGDPTRFAIVRIGLNRPQGEGPLEFDSNFAVADWIAAFSLYSSWGYTWPQAAEIADYETQYEAPCVY